MVAKGCIYADKWFFKINKPNRFYNFDPNAIRMKTEYWLILAGIGIVIAYFGARYYQREGYAFLRTFVYGILAVVTILAMVYKATL